MRQTKRTEQMRQQQLILETQEDASALAASRGTNEQEKLS